MGSVPELPIGTPNQARPLVPRSWRRTFGFFAIISVFLLGLVRYHNFTAFQERRFSCSVGGKHTVAPEPQCPVQAAIAPIARPDISDKLAKGAFQSDVFRNLSINRLAGAVQIPTQTFEDMGLLGEDPRWNNLYDLEQYFRDTFPLLHKKLDLEIINEHGLLYTWRGSNGSLKPVLLMSHQDTVPVAEDTLSEWNYPPFSGHFDGKYINGRGSHDCKNNVVAILSSITALLEEDFKPHRTVVLSFGFDEEGGRRSYGAGGLSKRMREIWGPDSFAIIIDEGAIGITERFGRPFGIPQPSEKGSFNLELTVHVPGGHSSMPPHHTSIGILAKAVSALEDEAESNFPLELLPENPIYTFLQCAAEDPLTDLPEGLRDAIRDPSGRDRVVKLLSNDSSLAHTLHTTQAVTIFQSGNKANALPAFAKATVNYRVSSSETLYEARAKLADTLKPVADAFSLNFTAGPRSDDLAMNGEDHASEVPQFTLDLSWRGGLEASPISSHESPSWTYFSGTIKHVFDEPGTGNDVIVTPMTAGGNTDTRFYWDLTSQIYRFGPLRDRHDEGWGGIHDVNERIALDAHLEAITFYHELIRVFDEAELSGIDHF